MSSDLDLAKVCSQAGEWIRQAGEVARRRFRSDVAVSLKADRSLLTEVDLEVQSLLTSAISPAHPDHHVLGEEGDIVTPSPNNRYTWVIDPLDGTRNYAHGFPCFSTAMALLDGPRPVIGLVLDPMAGNLFEAFEHGGMHLNGQPVQTAGRQKRRDLLIGFPGGRNLRIPRAIFVQLGRHVYLRNLGSTCLHLAMVASGALDGAYGRRAKLWDIAAGALLVAEARATISSPDGALFPFDPAGYSGQDLPFVAARAPVHEDLLRAMDVAIRPN